ncbi:hypothetical protein OHB44_21640 [Micromonospora sp. NBC_00821]|uniref:hypothetical protein n=1 Tax=Micromonospora sp. NBC_00821 TaxID=2975977 RepID=UPI002ED201FC|nr:hypothetical protein OHB44_21640 [Micromonospora sp. NBC_00821]
MAETHPALAALGVAQVLAAAEEVEGIGHELSAAVPATPHQGKFHLTILVIIDYRVCQVVRATTFAQVNQHLVRGCG